MSHVSVGEAAQRLNVSVGRVHERIRDGSLAAEKVGGRWLVSDVDLNDIRRRNKPGRPLSPKSAWALLAAASDGELLFESFSPSERSRSLSRLRKLGVDIRRTGLDDVAVVLGHVLRNRADRHLFYASPRDLRDIRDDSRVMSSGLDHPGSTISAADIAEGYVRAEDLPDLSEFHLMSPAPRNRANVVLHVLDPAVQPFVTDPVLRSELLYAADLAEHAGVRERIEALEAARRVVPWSEAARDRRVR